MPSPRSATSTTSSRSPTPRRGRRGVRPLRAAAVIVDAITGTGFNPPLTGLASTVVDDVNAAGVPVVADRSAERVVGGFRQRDRRGDRGGGHRGARRAEDSARAGAGRGLGGPMGGRRHRDSGGRDRQGLRSRARPGHARAIASARYRDGRRRRTRASSAACSSSPDRWGRPAPRTCRRWAHCARAPGWSPSRRRSRACPSWPRSAPNT